VALNRWDRSMRLYSAAAVQLSARPTSGERDNPRSKIKDAGADEGYQFASGG